MMPADKHMAPKTAAKSFANTAENKPKRVYERPTLVMYGSVRDLTTQISGAGQGDGQAKKNASEAALKQNIARIGDHPAGFGLYLFDYKPHLRGVWGHGRQFGVLAHEVERVIPAAVSWHADGHRVVDYALLGIARTGQ